MPTAEDNRLLKEQSDKITRVTGIPTTLIDNTAEKRQWWRPDGSKLPNLLPADAYHTRRFIAKGWGLVPPANPVPVETVRRGVVDGTGDAEVASNASTEASPTWSEIAKHAHRYNKAVGSVCKVNGCEAVRTTAYKKRGK
tara:strand:+ start:4471 stop:4890 length:420 start_codon:yes stop_codon:yes gene_type:complete